MDIHPATPEAYQLFHRGAIAFSEVEAAGMRIDLDYLDRTIEETGRRIAALEEKLRGCDEYHLQRKRNGKDTNLTSREQLAAVLFEDQGHECSSWTSGGKTGKKRRPQLDEEALLRIGTKYTKGFLRHEKLSKLHGTYLKGVRREVESDGLLHPFFNLHTVTTYRGSGSDPNFQNIPIRNSDIAKIIRRAFIPRDGHVLVEVDYGQIEVRVACCLSQDEKLTYDTLHGDMHRDMAAECFKLPVEEVTKAIRGTAKGGFVFAEFYGDWYKQCTRNLWDAIERRNLVTEAGVPLGDHLAAQGFAERGDCNRKQKEPRAGTFEAHIKAVEDRFWNDRFSVYNDTRKRWVEEYRERGYIDLVTGFRCHGPMRRNQVMNYHIQGPAFHCLMWSLTTLNVELKRRRMGTKIILQIHDSIVADVPLAEVDDYLVLVNEISTTRLRAAWDWITVPFTIEAELATTNWYDKQPVEIPV